MNKFEFEFVIRDGNRKTFFFLNKRRNRTSFSKRNQKFLLDRIPSAIYEVIERQQNS